LGYNPQRRHSSDDRCFIHSDRFASGLPYDSYLRTGTAEQQRRWNQVHDAARLTEAQQQLVGGFVRQMKILVFSGIWCGDCVEQCPLIHRIAEANPAKIDLRFIERPRDAELISELRINGGSRVPVVLFLSEDTQWCCATAGDRTINRYRALAFRRLLVLPAEPGWCQRKWDVRGLRIENRDGRTEPKEAS